MHLPHRRLPRPLGLLLGLAAAAVLPAQRDSAAVAPDRHLSVVTTSQAGVELSVGRNNHHGAVRTPAGILVVAVATETSPDGEPAERGIELHRSDDDGRTWQRAVRVDRPGDHEVAVDRH